MFELYSMLQLMIYTKNNFVNCEGSQYQLRDIAKPPHASIIDSIEACGGYVYKSYLFQKQKQDMQKTIFGHITRELLLVNTLQLQK